MSDEKHDSAPPKGAQATKEAPGEAREGRPAGALSERQAPPRGRRTSLFTVVTMAAGLIAMLLIGWRISKAWRIEYGSGPRDARPIPTTGAWGPPGASPRPADSSTGER